MLVCSKRQRKENNKSQSNLGRAASPLVTAENMPQWDAPNSPQNCLFPSGDLQPHLIHPFNDRPHHHPKRHPDPISRFATVHLWTYPRVACPSTPLTSHSQRLPRFLLPCDTDPRRLAFTPSQYISSLKACSGKLSLNSVGTLISGICDCLCVCLRSKRKTVRAINTKLGTHILCGSRLAYIDVRSKDQRSRSHG